MSKLLRPGRRTSAVAVTALAVCLASLSVVGGISPARALPAPPCGPTINADTPNDPALSAPLDAKAAVQTVKDDADHGGAPVDEVHLSWSPTVAQQGAGCVWIGRGIESVPDPAGGSFALAGVRATDLSFVDRPAPNQAGGPVCYRLVPISERGTGVAAEVCANVKNGRGPVVPMDAGDSPLPPDTGSGVAGTHVSNSWLLGLSVVCLGVGLSLYLRNRARSGR